MGAGKMKPILAICSLAGVVHIAVKGVVLNPPDLIQASTDVGKLNLGEYGHVLRSPAFLSLVAALAGAWLLRDRYLNARIQRTLRNDPARNVLLRLAPLWLAASLAEARWLSAALLSAIVAVFVLLHDAVLE
jgi:hypothetical protein